MNPLEQLASDLCTQMDAITATMEAGNAHTRETVEFVRAAADRMERNLMAFDEPILEAVATSEQPDEYRTIADKALLLAARWFKLNLEDDTLNDHPPSKADLAGMFDAMQDARNALLKLGPPKRDVNTQDSALEAWRKYQDDMRPETRNGFLRAYEAYFKSVYQIKGGKQ